MDFENTNETIANEATASIDDIMPSLLNGDNNAGVPAGEASIEPTENVPEGAVNENVPVTDASEASASVPQQENNAGEGNQNALLTAFENSLSRLESTQNELAQVKKRNDELEKLLSQQNTVAGETVEALAEAAPAINLGDILYLSPEEQNARFGEYTKSVAEYTRREMMKELAPLLGDYERTRAENEQASVYEALGKMSEFADVSEHKSGIDRILSKTPELESLPLEKRIILSYLADRGISAIKAPAPAARTAADIAAEALADPEVMRIIAEASYRQASEQANSVPPARASHGYGDAPVTIPKQPQSIDDVTKNLFNNWNG